MTQSQSEYISKRLRFAGLCIIPGLLVQGMSLLWNHPLSFLAFLGLGGSLLAIGIGVYLWSLVSPTPRV